MSLNCAPKLAGVSVKPRSIGRVLALVTSAASPQGKTPNTKTITMMTRLIMTRLRMRRHRGRRLGVVSSTGLDPGVVTWFPFLVGGRLLVAQKPSARDAVP